MRFHCRIPQHYLVLLSLSGCVVFAASTSCLLDAAGLAVQCLGCAVRESRRFLRQRFPFDRCDCALLIVVADASDRLLSAWQCHHLQMPKGGFKVFPTQERSLPWLFIRALASLRASGVLTRTKPVKQVCHACVWLHALLPISSLSARRPLQRLSHHHC